MKVVDMHCDTISELLHIRKQWEHDTMLENHLQIDLNKMQKGDYLLQNFAMFVHLGREKDPFYTAMKLIDLFYTELEPYSDRIGIVKSWKEMEENRKAGKMSALLTLEEGGVCRGDLSCLRDFYRLGARMMTITWNFPNELGFPNGKDESVTPARAIPDTVHGLTETGIAFVQEMERLGMIIDISHLNDAGIRDIFELTHGPVIASHSNARTLCSHLRNLSDNNIRMIGERGGVIGINYFVGFLEDGGKIGRIEKMVEHMQYIKNLAGIDAIALGSDFDGFGELCELSGAEKMQQLASEMERQGFSSAEIDKVFSLNALRVFRSVLS